MHSYFPSRWVTRPAVALMTVLALNGCTTDSLDVTDPDILNTTDYNTVNGTTPLRNGALQDFTNVFSGTADGFVVLTGDLADEVITTDTFDDRLFPNQRMMNPNLPSLDTYYQNMHRARTGLGRAIPVWNQFKPTQKDTIAEMYALRGYIEDFFGETYCSGVPFSVDTDAGTVFGKPLTTAEIFSRSLASLDSAASTAVAANIKNLAAIGRGRVLLNQGQYAAAAAAVAGVPTSYKYQLLHSAATTRQQNGIWSATNNGATRYAVGTNEGTNGLPFLKTPADPRVPWTTSVRTGFDGTTRNLPNQGKYGANASPSTLADGIEARLIELEARLQGNTAADRDAVFKGLNDLRATGLATAIPAIATAPTTQDGMVNLLFEERAYWLWLTGHRLGDLRRLVRLYGRDQATVFPIGQVLTRPAGTVYGTDVNFPVPFNETNNPNFTGCLDRKA